MFEKIEEKYNYLQFFQDIIAEFGGEGRNEKKKFILRKYLNDKGSWPAKGAYFGCIREGEDSSGAYSDLSIVVFPSNEENEDEDRWLINFGVGSMGYKNDYDIVSLPGIRRMFSKHLDMQNSFVKNDFMDIETSDGMKSFLGDKIPETLQDAVENYTKVILSASLINPNDETATKNEIKKYLAIYADLRKWMSNSSQRKAVEKALNAAYRCPLVDDKEEVKKLLKERKYVVLQGAPGTGKTRLAKELAENGQVFFAQFHAETSYSDFVYGIKPDTNEGTLRYIGCDGILVSTQK